MQILLSAFACAPGRGSEHGVGWEWPKALSEICEHDVTVLTHARNRPAIEAYLASHPEMRVRFRYLDGANWFGGLGSLGHYLFYYCWQVRIVMHLLITRSWRQYDVIHHLTYGGIRSHSLLFLFPRAFLIGPLGGGEIAPPALARGLGRESVRS